MASQSLIATLFLIIIQLIEASAKGFDSPIVDLGYAKYRGIYNEGLGIAEFRGIPFAAPPIGPLRWKAPQPFPGSQDSATTLINATESGPACIQGYPAWTIQSNVQISESEDCLKLNIFVPDATKKDEKLPVVLTIPGGGYVMGQADQGSPYALMKHSNNAFIYVVIQYRLGAYGFLGSKSFLQEGGLANIGLLDQRLAIEWVQEHIEAFGGDPERITIQGGSAGGGSVTNHLIWKGGIGKAPFRAAMADFPWWQQFLREDQLVRQYVHLLEAASCSTLSCLRKLDEQQLKQATQSTYLTAYDHREYGYGNFYYGPYVDGDLIQDLPSREFSRGHFTKVPVWTSREGYEGWSFSNQSMTTQDEAVEDVNMQFPYADESFAQSIFDLYPREHFNSTFWQRATWFGDFSINCPTYYLAKSVTPNNNPVYKQIFNVGTQTHGAVGPYLGDLNYGSTPGANTTLANILKDWWVSFAIHGDPNAESWSNATKPTWPTYASGEVMSVNFTEIGAVQDAYYDATKQCDFFWEFEDVVQN